VSDSSGPAADDQRRGEPRGGLSPALRFAVVVGVLEALALAAYAVSIAVFAVVGQTSGVSGTGEVASPVLAIVLLALAALVVLVVVGLVRRRAAARVPFFLVQAFAVVAAWPLATGGLGWERALGVGFIVVAAAAAYVALSARGTAELDR